MARGRGLILRLLLLSVVGLGVLLIVVARERGARTPAVGPELGVESRLVRDGDPDATEQGLARFHQAGGRWVRETIPWVRIEQRPGKCDWLRVDRLADVSGRLGLQVVATLAYCPRWARLSAGPARSTPPRDPAEFAAFAYRVASRYRGRIRHYEIWNEADWAVFWAPGLPFPERVRRYREMLRLTAAAIRQADPDARILNAGLALANGLPEFAPAPPGERGIPRIRSMSPLPPGESGPEWLDSLLAEDGTAASFDLLACHLMRVPGAPVLEPVGAVTSRRQVAKPLWITECGWPSGPAAPAESPGAQVSFLEDAYAASVRAGARVLIWHELMDRDADPGNRESHYGLLTLDMQEKPVFARLRQLLASPPAP